MSRGILVKSCLGQARLVNGMAEEAWLVDHHNAMFARQAETLVDLVQPISSLARRAWEAILDATLGGRVEDFDDLERRFQEALDCSVQAIGQVERLIADVNALGYTVDNASQFGHLKADVEAIVQEFRDFWSSTAFPEASEAAPAPVAVGPAVEPVVAHTERRSTKAEMAAALDQMSRPRSEESAPLPF